MTVWGIEGGAGVGKTTRLIEKLGAVLKVRPLAEDQRVLALTFMHGSRRRLHHRLREIQMSTGRFAFECSTVDSFAYRLLRRWVSLAGKHGIPHALDLTHEERCDRAGQLLELPHVRAWVVARYPILLIDEAQDLGPERLRIARNMAIVATTLIAADDFQCLDEKLRPNPAVSWVRAACNPDTLTVSRRTNTSALLACAAALRAGNIPVSGKGMQIKAATGVSYAAALMASAIAWNQASTLAVITPAIRGGFAQNVVARVAANPCGTKKYGPYAIEWETSDRDACAETLAALDLAPLNSRAALIEALQKMPASWVVRETANWLQRQHRVRGIETFSRAEIEDAVQRQAQIKGHFVRSDRRGRLAMTVHQAKNREFDGVIVMWPYQVKGDEEHKRRLLYNAITRARRWCIVIAQNPSILKQAPFA